MIINKSQPNSLITLTIWSHHETFIRRSWYSVLPDLDVTISCHITKTVEALLSWWGQLSTESCLRSLWKFFLFLFKIRKYL